VYRIAEDARAASWVVDGVRGFAESVVSLVPTGFPAYVRIFHPVHIDGVQMTWAAIAHANGKRVHPGMQIHSIGTPAMEALNCTGHLERTPAAALLRTLARHTNTPDVCWVAVWEGLGRLPPTVRDAPTFTLPKRRYHLLTGPIDTALDDVLGRSFGYQSPNLCWPDDRSWLVATEIDLHSTYIGCTADCAADVLATPELEALAVPPETGITFDSDALN
jgi:hypothetical protein